MRVQKRGSQGRGGVDGTGATNTLDRDDGCISSGALSFPHEGKGHPGEKVRTRVSPRSPSHLSVSYCPC